MGNTAVGWKALRGIGTGVGNTAIGRQAGLSMSSGTGGTFAGWNAGYSVTGATNTCVGYQAGQYTTALTSGSENVLLGSNVHTSAADSTNQIVIGHQCAGNANDSFVIGNGTTDSAIAFGATSITAPSDIRLKEDIQDEVVGLDFINALRPVTFRWKKEKDVPEDMNAHKADSEERVMNGKYNHGFIAQEVKEVIDQHPDIKDGFDMWTEDEADGRQRIGDGALIPMLTKAVQELSAEIEKLKKEQN